MDEKCFSTRFGLYVGEVAIASTFPVFGSSATAAPHWPRNACCATYCTPGLIVSTTLLPVTVAPFSLSQVFESTVFRFVFDEVRELFSERSMPARAYDCVE